MITKSRLRLYYLIMTILLLIVEVLIALYVSDNFIRPYVGDVLVVVVIYTFVRIFIPERVRVLPFIIFIFAVGVEMLQYFQIIKVIGLQDNIFFRVLIGSTFDVKDIVCYGVGCVVLGVYELVRYVSDGGIAG